MKLHKDIMLASSIAFKIMGARLKQTIISMTGVAFGITVFIFLMSMMTGSNEYIADLIFEQSPNLRLYNEPQIAEKSILDQISPQAINIVHHIRPKDILLNLKDGKQVIQDLQQDPRIKAVSGSVNTQVFYRLGASSINGMVSGIDFEAENRLFNLVDRLEEGSFQELSTVPNSMVMGIGLARKLNVTTGDLLNITTETGQSFLITVTGIFKTGITDIDDQQSYADINTVQRFLNVPASYITDISANLYDREQAPEISQELQNRYDFHGSDWKADNATFLQGEVLRDLITYGVAVTILLVAGFGIYNILTMMIYEKLKDIAILKAMGFSDTDVRWIFLTQALVIGIIGAVFGLLFGYLSAVGLSRVPYETDVVITLDHLPVSFDIMFYITGFIFAILTTTLAGYIPSRKAANVDPISILRG